jgi:hypothetical protein
MRGYTRRGCEKKPQPNGAAIIPRIVPAIEAALINAQVRLSDNKKLGGRGKEKEKRTENQVLNQAFLLLRPSRVNSRSDRWQNERKSSAFN